MPGLMPSIESSQELIVVSNGVEFFRIPSEDLGSAQADGFYRPQDRGLTIVSDGESQFEIPSSELQRAEANGFRNLLSATPNEASVAVSFEATFQDDLEHLTDPSEEELEQQRLLAETEGWRRLWLQFQFWIQARRNQLTQQLGGMGISILVHIAVVLLLASFVLMDKKPEVLGLVATVSNTDDVVDDVVIEVTPVEIFEPTEVVEPEAEAEASEVPMELSAEAPDLSGDFAGAAIQAPAKPQVKPSSKPMKPTIFGSKLAATNYVFVIDNSNSMTGGRFETALHELMLTVNQLTPKQRFYIIFYSDTAYPMMHPKAVLKLVPATEVNKKHLFEWLQTVPLCLRTNGMEALQAAFNLNPDVIYILGDGAFTDNAGKYFAARPHERIIVNTLGMEVKEKDAVAFRELAKSNRGTYKDVGVSPEGKAMAQKSPRPRNTLRGPVWGLKLPLKK
jgi:von Willebrand factor type A domain